MSLQSVVPTDLLNRQNGLTRAQAQDLAEKLNQQVPAQLPDHVQEESSSLIYCVPDCTPEQMTNDALAILAQPVKHG